MIYLYHIKLYIHWISVILYRGSADPYVDDLRGRGRGRGRGGRGRRWANERHATAIAGKCVCACVHVLIISYQVH